MIIAAVPLTTRGMSWGRLSKTVTRMEAGVEPPGTVRLRQTPPTHASIRVKRSLIT